MSLYLRVGAAAAVSEDDGVVRQHLPSSSDEGSRDGGGCVCWCRSTRVGVGMVYVGSVCYCCCCCCG